jgi:predicted transposase YdaD
MDIIIESPLYQEIMRRGRTRGREEGVEEGPQEGRQEGRQEELRNVLTKLLNRKFGVVSEAVHGEIEMLSIEQAESLVEAILDFEKPEDLQNWLAQNLKPH